MTANAEKPTPDAAKETGPQRGKDSQEGCQDTADHKAETPSTAAVTDEALADAEPDIKSEADPVGELQAEVARLKDQMLRALAEAENTRRRAEKDRIEAQKYAPAALARDLISVADNLRRALEALPEGLDDSLKPFADGVALVEKALSDAFAKHHIERVEPLGEKFDPHAHEAMFEAPIPGVANGTVFQVMEPGYKLHDRLLRPARVGVAKAAPEQQSDQQKTDQQNNQAKQ